MIFSAGVGRTGIFITLSIVLERMQYEGVVDVFQTVRILRTQRTAMVQTEVICIFYFVKDYFRLCFFYLLILKFLKKPHTIGTIL